MRKKVKSFAAEEESHDKLSSMFKANYVDVTLSYCLNKYIKELLVYLETVEKGIQDSSHTIPMAFVIETVTREPIFKVLESQPRPGETESSLEMELNELQGKYDVHIKRNPAAAVDLATSKLEKQFPITTVLTYLAKSIAGEIRTRGNMTDDEYVQLFNELGGKEFRKYMREKVVPVVDKIDPDMKDVIRKFRKTAEEKGDKGE